jgi:hypothetical protein
MSNRRRALWALAIAVSILCLMAPALWNRFPLLEWDTGDYIGLWFNHALSVNRGAAYGIVLDLGARYGFWPVVAVQSALAVWVMALMLRAHGLGGRPLLLARVTVALSVLTTLPWLTAVLLTDIFAGLGVFAAYLLLLRADRLAGWERAGLLCLLGFSVASHGATLAVVAGLVVVAALVSRLDRKRIPAARLGLGAAGIALGITLIFAANYVVAGKLAWTPGGFSVAFGRMLQDGIVKKYLDAHCPDPELRLLCRYKDQLPQDADDFFWHDPLFAKLGGFEGLRPEMKRIAVGSLAAYPWLQVRTAAIATAKQFVMVHTGEGVVNVLWHTHRMIREHVPDWAPAMQAARQYQARTDAMFAQINVLHYPLALAAMALLPLIALFGFWEWLPPPLAELSLAAMLALLGNSLVCGVLSNPHDRYGARMVWIAGFVVLLVVAHALESLRRRSLKPLSSAEPLFY